MSFRVPPKPVPDEDGFMPSRWWQANDKDGNLLVETSDPEDFERLNLIDQPGVTIFRIYKKETVEYKMVQTDPQEAIKDRRG